MPSARRSWRTRTEVKGIEVLIGVDPHKATNSAAAVSSAGELLEYATFSASRQGLRALRAWAKRFGKRRWAIEGANGL